MITTHIRQRLSAALLLALLLAACGCGQSTAKIDLAELHDPFIKKAKAKTDQGDLNGALQCLNLALDKRPRLAQAHLDAGLLYDDFKKDYARAIYHYQRYLELRPDTEKKAMIEDLIHKAKMSLAALVSDQLPGFSGKLKALEDENTRLKNDLREVRENLAKRMLMPIGTPAEAFKTASVNPDISATALPSAGAGQTYLVQERDTLSLIATKVYQDPGKWRKILEANRGILSAPEKLRPGQVLIIPQ